MRELIRQEIDDDSFGDLLGEVLGGNDSGMFAQDTDAFGNLIGVDEVLDKLQCEQSLEEFTSAAWDLISDKPLVMSPHITLLCRHLEAVSRKQISRLLVNIPPGLTKSTLIGVMWPAWTWTWYPESRFFFFAYHQDLVKRDSTLCKKILRSEWYTRFWAEKTAPAEDDTKMFYRNVAGGWRRASVIRGLGTGEHPDFIGIDDPLSREDAKSETGRLECKRWYFETMSSRGMTRDVAHVVSAQRLDEEDLPGAILEQIELDKGTDLEGRWHHIMLPMHFDPKRAMPDRGHGGDWRTKAGELLAPKILNAKQVALLERDLQTSDPSGPASQLEQNPKKVAGDMFKINRLKRIRRAEVPKMDKLVRYWDRAATKGGTGCNTAGVLLGLRGEMVFILTCAADRWSVDEVYIQMSTCAIVDEATYGGVEFVEIGIEQEPGSGGKEAAENAMKRLKAHRVEVKPPTGNKEARAQPVANAIAFGEVYIVEEPGEDWYAPFLEELRKFPNGRKDRVDALSGAYLKLVGQSKKRGTRVRGVRGMVTLCSAPGCGRPVEGEAEYCCVSCEAIASFNDGTVCTDHLPECNVRNFDHQQRR